MEEADNKENNGDSSSETNVVVKKRTRKKKIRVELIKDSVINEDEIKESPAEDDNINADTPAENAEIKHNEAPLPEAADVITERNGRRRKQTPGEPDTSDKEKLSINDLTRMSLPDLRDFAVNIGVIHENIGSLRKQELIFNILKAHTSKGGIIHAYGSLEILPDGYGFLRSPQNSYLPGSDDIYISPSQIRLFNLRTGDTVGGQIRPPREGERFFAMLRVESVNYDDPKVAQTRVPFDNLTPLYPEDRINMETAFGDPTTRMINLFCPIGKGQRGLIVAPPRNW